MDNLREQTEVLWEVLLETREKLVRQEREFSAALDEQRAELQLAGQGRIDALTEKLAQFDEVRHELFERFNLDTATGLKALLAPGVVDTGLLAVQCAALDGETATRPPAAEVPFAHPLAAPRITVTETTRKRLCYRCGFASVDTVAEFSSDVLAPVKQRCRDLDACHTTCEA